MPSYSSSAPTIVYKQATQPTAEAGAFWYDTSTTDIYFSDGVVWNKLTSGSVVVGLESMISEIILSLVALAADAAVSQPTYESMFVDKFTDASGEANTIDTGNTTAVFDTNEYVNFSYSSGGSIASSVTDDTTSGAGTDKKGIKITTGSSPIQIVSIDKYSNVAEQANRAYVYNAALDTQMGVATFSGDTATFSSPIQLAASTSYYLLVDGNGGSVTHRRNNSFSSYPITNSNVNIVASYDGSADTTSVYYSIPQFAINVGARGNLVIRTNAEALSFTPVYAYVFADTTLAGTGSVTFDLSFDGGSTWDITDGALFTKLSVADGSSKNMILRMKLNKGASNGTAEASDYAVLLWSS